MNLFYTCIHEPKIVPLNSFEAPIFLKLSPSEKCDLGRMNKFLFFLHSGTKGDSFETPMLLKGLIKELSHVNLILVLSIL